MPIDAAWIHMMVAIGGIGEGFVSRLGAQGLPCVGGPRWLRGFGVVQNRRLARICGLPDDGQRWHGFQQASYLAL